MVLVSVFEKLAILEITNIKELLIASNIFLTLLLMLMSIVNFSFKKE